MLKLVEVPDMTVPHAFDDLVKTVDAIRTIIDATLAINDNIFAASLQAPSVKRIIITGSIVSTMALPDVLFRPITVSADDYSTITNEQGLSSLLAADVEDVASIHVKSLDLKVLGNERYLFHSGHPQNSSEVAKKIREEYPQLRNRVPKVLDKSAESLVKVKVDTSKSDKVFRGPWKDWWESAKDTVDDIVKFEK
ncbi:hypothetical protein VE02_09908 [Pseudogymnoascus sp. 03VT05]|nr:hypothetical protein VE02_09908 [Pseudogymnoascus sp. 03VT05]